MKKRNLLETINSTINKYYLDNDTAEIHQTCKIAFLAAYGFNYDEVNNFFQEKENNFESDKNIDLTIYKQYGYFLSMLFDILLSEFNDDIDKELVLKQVSSFELNIDSVKQFVLELVQQFNDGQIPKYFGHWVNYEY